MTGREAYGRVRDVLQSAGIEDAGIDAEYLLRHVTGQSRFLLDEVSGAALALLLKLARRRARRQPLAYVLGRWPFMDVELAVGPGVLVPRPETEEVCLAALETLEGKTAPVVLDLCSGSGALALAVQSRYPAARVAAVERSAAAFAYLVRNVNDFSAHHPRAPRPVRADVFAYGREAPPESVDLIVCNPPYVTPKEYLALAPEVRAEPREALVAPPDGLAFYPAVADGYAHCLVPGGALVFETGAGQGAAVQRMVRNAGYAQVQVRRDLAGHERIVTGRKPAPGAQAAP